MKWIAAALAVVVLIVVATPASASRNGYHDIVTFGNRVVVQRDQDVGDLVVYGGSAEVFGHVHGDAVVFGGTLHIAPEGVVDGDTVAIGGAVYNESRAHHGATSVATPEPTEPPMETPMPTQTPEAGVQNVSFGPSAWQIIVVIDALLSLVAFVLFPWRTDHSIEQLHEQPLISLVLGFLSPLILATVVIVLAVTVVGIPLIPVAILAYMAAYYIGKAALASFIGSRFMQLAKVEQRPLMGVVIGLLVMMALTLPTPIGFAIPFMSLIGCVAVGMAMTSFMRSRPAWALAPAVNVTPPPAPPQPGTSGPPVVQ